MKLFTEKELEYVAFVARKFCNLHEDSRSDLVVQHALESFRFRYEYAVSEQKENLYFATESLQGTISRYGYDSKEFWLLLVFLKDFTESCYGDSLIFDSLTVGDNLQKMLNILSSPSASQLIIKSDTDSASISTLPIKDELMALINIVPNKENVNIYPYIKTSTDNVLAHKIKFFCDMLDYFLEGYNPIYTQITHHRKDWAFVARLLYLVDYLDHEKYFTGEYEVVSVSGKKAKATIKGVGKFLKDMIKNCRDTSNRSQSTYCYNPYFDMILD